MKRLSYDVVEEQRVLKLRPSCLESYVAGMGRRSERIAHSDRCDSETKHMAHAVQGVPTFEADFRRATLDPWATSRSGKRVSLLGDHQESKAQSVWSIPGLGKNPQVSLAMKHWKSQTLSSVLPPQLPLTRVSGPCGPKCSL